MLDTGDSPAERGGSLAGGDITYFVPASQTSPILLFYKHIWAVGGADIRMTIDSLSGLAVYKTFVVRDSYTGSYNMIYADPTNGIQLANNASYKIFNATHSAGITMSTNGGSFFNADANAEVSIYGGGQSDKDQPITLWGSNITIKAITALGSLGTITLTDASNVALSNITWCRNKCYNLWNYWVNGWDNNKWCLFTFWLC